VKAVTVAVVLLALLSACSHLNRVGTGHTLSQDEIDTATRIVHQQITDKGARPTSAWVVVRLGVVQQPNTGHPCTSGRSLAITMVGRFNTVTTGNPVRPGDPPQDFTVRSVGITVDARTGRPCLIGVGTTREEPPPGATVLPVR